MSRPCKSLIALVVAALVAALAGCTAKHYKQSADKQVYDILAKKQAAVFGTEENYQIEQLATNPFVTLVRAEKFPLELPEDLKRAEVPPLIISLANALEIANYNSRDFQSQKENVYLTALTLTERRYDFSSQFTGIISSFWNKDPFDENVTVDSGFSVSKLLKTGASIGINLSTEFLRHLTGDPRQTAASILAVQIIQPLWRGAGSKVVTENLQQAERDVIYDIRSFARFKESFTVAIASTYYRLLEQRAVVRNERGNYNDLIEASKRAKAMADAGRLPQFQVDQASQNELSAKDRWVTSLQRYYQQLDSFKIDLGIPTDSNVDVDDADLAALEASGIVHPALSSEEAVAIALERRLDLKNTEDQVADAERKIYVAQNALGPDVNVVFETSTPTQPTTHFGEFRFEQTTWNAGLDVNLPLNRLNERNSYRTSLINLARAQREFSLGIDTVKFEVRNSWRTLQQTKASYEIQKSSVELALKRVDSTKLLQQAGRADTRDLLESQSALIAAQNGVIAALTDHTIARLQFYRDIEALKIDKEGLWHEEDFSGKKEQEPQET